MNFKNSLLDYWIIWSQIYNSLSIIYIQVAKKEAKPTISKHFSIFGTIILVVLIGLLGYISVLAKDIYFKDSQVTTTLNKQEDVTQADVLVVHFSSPIFKNSLDGHFSVEPKINFQSWWETDQDLYLQPLEPLRDKTVYNLMFQGLKTQWLIPIDQQELSFETPAAPKLVEVSPQDGQADVDYFEPIRIKLDKPLGNDYAVQVVIDPLTGFKYLLDESRQSVSIIPTEKLNEGATYNFQVSINNKNFKDQSQVAYKGSFTTRKPITEVTYMMDKEGNAIKTEPQKEPSEALIKEGRYVDINLRTQTLRVYENGVEKGVYKVSSGKRAMPTPEGQYKVLVKAKRPFSKDYGLYMPWFIGFTNLGHGIHELPEWPSGYKEGANHLGTPVSHGCVRLGVGPAKIVFDFVEVGTPIVIHR